MTLLHLTLALLGVSLTSALQDGTMYRILKAGDKQALAPVSAEPENDSELVFVSQADQPNQTWLAVQTSGEDFLLVSRLQKWDWSKFSSGGLLEKNESLPESAWVLSEDKAGHYATVSFRNGSLGQNWKSIRVQGRPYHLLKNADSERCLKSPKKGCNLFKGLISHLKQASQVLTGNQDKKAQKYIETLECNEKDDGQHWILEQVN